MAGTHSRRSFFPLALVVGFPHSSQPSHVSLSFLKSALSTLSVNSNKSPVYVSGGGEKLLKGLLSRKLNQERTQASLSCIEDAGGSKPPPPATSPSSMPLHLRMERGSPHSLL